ncbi:hypothetical protein EV363DRAFT_1296254 [Boletus edulis]|nr:hypothetical protein EV363DRAFT_1296254 [Boletus edulis]
MYGGLSLRGMAVIQSRKFCFFWMAAEISDSEHDPEYGYTKDCSGSTPRAFSHRYQGRGCLGAEYNEEEDLSVRDMLIRTYAQNPDSWVSKRLASMATEQVWGDGDGDDDGGDLVGLKFPEGLHERLTLAMQRDSASTGKRRRSSTDPEVWEKDSETITTQRKRLKAEPTCDDLDSSTDTHQAPSTTEVDSIPEK